jgi:hypothetical protein
MHGAVLRQTFQLHRFDLIFLIVRDPIARFRSEYLWRNRKTEVSLDVDAIDHWGFTAFADYARNHYLFDNHFRPQIEFAVPGALVYYFEDGLDEVVRRLNADHGLGLDPIVPHVRTAKGATGASSGDVVISERLGRRIREFYFEDFHTFGYAKPARVAAGESPIPRGGTTLVPLPPGRPRTTLAIRRSRRKARAFFARVARRLRRGATR